jgi:hypothetical protein
MSQLKFVVFVLWVIKFAFQENDFETFEITLEVDNALRFLQKQPPSGGGGQQPAGGGGQQPPSGGGQQPPSGGGGQQPAGGGGQQPPSGGGQQPPSGGGQQPPSGGGQQPAGGGGQQPADGGGQQPAGGGGGGPQQPAGGSGGGPQQPAGGSGGGPQPNNNQQQPAGGNGGGGQQQPNGSGGQQQPNGGGQQGQGGVTYSSSPPTNNNQSGSVTIYKPQGENGNNQGQQGQGPQQGQQGQGPQQGQQGQGPQQGQQGQNPQSRPDASQYATANSGIKGAQGGNQQPNQNNPSGSQPGQNNPSGSGSQPGQNNPSGSQPNQNGQSGSQPSQGGPSNSQPSQGGPSSSQPSQGGPSNSQPDQNRPNQEQINQVNKYKAEVSQINQNYIKYNAQNNQPQDMIVKSDTFTVQIFDSNSYKQNEAYAIENKLTLVDVTPCLEKIRQYLNISESVNIPIEKVDWDTTIANAGKKLGDVTYNYYNPTTGEKLNSTEICSNTTMEIKIPVNTSELNLTLYNQYKTRNINIFDKTSGFYNSVCFPFQDENGFDVPLTQRAREVYQNISFACSTGCSFDHIDEKGFIVCYCTQTDSTTAVQDNTILDGISSSNIGVFSCVQRAFDLVS